MDSFSQSGPNLNDEVQQSHWGEETNKLWSEATSRKKTFDFKTIDDVLEENALCKEENDRLNDIIAEDIKQLKDNVTSLDNAISDVNDAVEINSAAISDVNDEVTSLSNTVDTNTASISDVNDEVVHNSERISSVFSSATLNTKHIADNCEAIAANADSISDVETTLTDEISNVSITLTESISVVDSKVEGNSAQITSVIQDVASLTSSDQQQNIVIEGNIMRLDSLSTRGRWCGYQSSWDYDKGQSTILYEELYFSDTNMDVSPSPLNLLTGSN